MMEKKKKKERKRTKYLFKVGLVFWGHFWALDMFESDFGMTKYIYKLYVVTFIYFMAPYIIYVWHSVLLSVRHSLSFFGLVREEL